MDNGWPGKSVCLFYIDLMHDVVSMTLFLVFMLTFFVQNPSRLPIYMMADVIQVARKLAQRLRSFRRYRRISLNMDMRFPDVTDEEIEQNEHCVICRDSLYEGSKPKKLPCNHIFHIDCLRSWLVMQQVCPTCRAEISADGPTLPIPTPAAPAQAGVADQAAAAVPGGAPAPTPTSTTAPAPSGATSAAATPASAATGAGASSATSVGAASQMQTPSGPPVQTSATDNAALFAPSAASVPKAGTVSSGTVAATSAASLPLLGVAGAQGLGVNMGILGSFQTLPPVNEIVESIQRAEEVAKFLRQQTEFWMSQVRQIEQMQTQSQSQSTGTNFGSGGIGANPADWTHLLAAAGCAPPSSGSTVPASSGAAAPSSPTSGGPARESSHEAGSPSGAGDQMSELRRAQQAQWERRRSTSSLNNGQEESSGPTTS